MSTFRLRAILGVLIYDALPGLWALRPRYLSFSKFPWLKIKNRHEQLLSDQNNEGLKCDWDWTSSLHLPKILPIFGRWLYRRALKDFPVALQEQPLNSDNSKPDVSFIIGYRGKARLPLLLMAVNAIAGQSERNIELIVVEQDDNQYIKNLLPEWVRYIHTPLPDENMAYSRSWAFNVGAKEAQSDFLIFQDNDMLIPRIYANELLKRYHEGYEVINLKRFIFYLNKESTLQVCAKVSTNILPGIEAIMQNAEGGGSIGISRQAFFEVGGFDGRFIGWGGEDNEFWERAQTRTVYAYGYLPFVHLWHAPQANALQPNAEGAVLYRELREQSVDERIRKLRAMR